MIIESKAKITKKLFELLQMTRDGEDIEDMEYVNDPNSIGREHVYIKYKDGYMKRVNVSMDSGSALIRDVLREIY